jgi:hypothetical protein
MPHSAHEVGNRSQRPIRPSEAKISNPQATSWRCSGSPADVRHVSDWRSSAACSRSFLALSALAASSAAAAAIAEL